MLKANISAYYQSFLGLKKALIEVQENEIVGVLGVNASGKTTLLNAIFGLVENTEGKIFFRKENILGLCSKSILDRGIGLVPQTRELFRGMSVEENLLLGAMRLFLNVSSNQTFLPFNFFSKKKLAKKQMLKNYHFVFDLFPVLKQKKRLLAGNLSGGEQQMLLIARTLMLSPKLLLLDEPMTGLSPQVQKSIETELHKIVQTGCSVLMTEQKSRASLHLFNRFYFIEEGVLSASQKKER